MKVFTLSHQHRMWSDSIKAALGTAFGLGYSPVAPGTAGSLLGVAVFIVIALASGGRPVEKVLLALALTVTCCIAVPIGDWAERYWKRKDPRCFVLDEVAGFLLTVLLFRGENLVLTTAWAFVVTRICDIVKPFPARRMERIPGGWGILLDDLVASLYAAAFLYVVLWIAPWAMGQ